MKACIFGPVCALVLVLTSCATPNDPAQEPAWAAAVPPPEISIDLPLETDESPSPRICQLGTSCLALDPRPFEACLLSARHCERTAELLQVRDPEAAVVNEAPSTVRVSP